MMIINVVYDSSVGSCPQEAAFKACVQGVANFYESKFNDPISITWHVGWGEVDGESIPNNGGAESISNYTRNLYTYAQIRAAFAADATSAADRIALKSLPIANPTGNGTFAMTVAEAKALGLSYRGSLVDGFSGLDKTSAWVFNTTNTNGNSTLAVNGTDAFSFLAHELSEVLGRQMNFAPGDKSHWGPGYYPYDLFDYTAPGVRSFDSTTADRYFSDDGGTKNTGLHYFNTNESGDTFDTVQNGHPSSYLPNGPPDSFDWAGDVGAVSSEDITLMDVLGYNLTPTITWSTATSGSFTSAGNWRGGAAPSGTTTATLSAGGSTAYTVTSDTSVTVSSIQTAATATLAITGGTFTDTNGTGVGVNAGTVSVSGATLAAGGIFSNKGSVSIDATGTLLVADSGLVLERKGALSLAGTVEGASEGATLTNDGVITGSGQLGDGVMTLVNLAGGRIESLGADALTINTGAKDVTNLGLIESNGAGGLVINGGLVNGSTPSDKTTVKTSYGELEAKDGVLTVEGSVTGPGTGVIAGGTLQFDHSFNEDVTFLTAKGALDLRHSVDYTSTITGFSGSDELILRDIHFRSADTTASYAGTRAGGVLTITDGVRTATLNLVGDYLKATWSVAAATGGGTQIVEGPATTLAVTSTSGQRHAFVAAMAAFAPPHGAHESWQNREAYGSVAALATPRLFHHA